MASSMTQHHDNRLLAVACILAGVGVASTQDAIVKTMSGGYPVYETLMFRCIGSVPVLAVLLHRTGAHRRLMTAAWPRLAVRGFILGLAYLFFVLAIAAMPMANAVAIYFTMPFFVAGLAGPLLGERVRLHRWLAILAGFTGVMVMVRPGAGVFEPAALLALISALGYAVGQMIGRPLSRQVEPIVISVWQNAIYFSIGLALAVTFGIIDIGAVSHPSLSFLTRPLAIPDLTDGALLFGHGMLAGFGMLLFNNAYKYAEANFVAPFEYSAMIWALLFGLFIFADIPDAHTMAGAAMVVTAGLLMVWRDRVLDRSLR
jgi:drug/metabolite transporter (DMT)-like permease